jgi:hypothetical protein
MCLIWHPPQSADCHPWTLDFGIHAEMTVISISARLVYNDERSAWECLPRRARAAQLAAGAWKPSQNFTNPSFRY